LLLSSSLFPSKDATEDSIIKLLKLLDKINKLIQTKQTGQTKIDEIMREFETITRSTKRVITIHPNRYTDPTRVVFKTLIKDNNHALFIYNENFGQLRSGDKNEGGGNATIRPYRQDIAVQSSQEFSLGIPTGFVGDSSSEPDIDAAKTFDMKGTKFVPFPTNPALDNTDTLLQSLYNIYHFIDEHENITDVYYSAETDNKRDLSGPEHQLGLGLFSDHIWTQKNIKQMYERTHT